MPNSAANRTLRIKPRQAGCLERWAIYMDRFSNKANGRSYIIQSVIGLGVYGVLAAVVSVRIFSAPQLSPLTKFSVCGFLWGLLIWFAVVLRRYYRRLPDE